MNTCFHRYSKVSGVQYFDESYFNRADSKIVTVTLPRPAGITFQQDSTGLVRVVEINRNTGYQYLLNLHNHFLPFAGAGQRQALERLGGQSFPGSR